MLHIGIVWANPYSNNLGVGALAYSALALISDVCREAGIEADFALIGSINKRNDKIFIRDHEVTFTNILGNDHIKWRSLAKLALLPKKYETKAVLNFDIVFDISEGDSFTDIYGKNRFEKTINSKRFFNLLKIPQVLLPQTIGPFKSKSNEADAFKVMKKMDLVISRDRQSLDYTSRFLPADKTMEAIDVAFYMPFKKASFPSEKIQVGLNISGLLWNGGYTKKNQFGMKSDYRTLIENTANYFTSLPDVTLHFVSHVINRRKSVEDDYSVAEAFQRKYPGTILAPSFYSPIEAKSYISGLDFFSGARMHACIAAFSSGVAVFPMAYSRKFNGLFGETLQYKRLGDCINEGEDVILTNLKAAFEARTEAKKEIDHSLATIVAPRLDALKSQLLNSIKKVKPKK